MTIRQSKPPTSGVPRVTARVHGRHTIFKFGRNDSSSGFLVLSAIGDLDLRKPSHRPVNILPNARREVSSGLRMPPALRPFCLKTQREVAAELEAAGHTSKGKRYSATAVARMVAA